MKKQSGFTLIELLLVLAIIGIIAAIAIPALLGQREKAKIRATEALMNNIAAEVVRASDDLAGRFPPNVAGHASIHFVLNLNNYKYPNAKNPYGGTLPPYIVHSPGELGRVGLEFFPVYVDPATGDPHPAVLLRTQYLKNGTLVSTSKFVAVD